MNDVRECPVTFVNEGMQIVGMLHKPGGDRLPAIILFHGCTGSKLEDHWLFVKLARALAADGFMVLRFDFRYSGDSDGNFDDMTLSGEISDGLRSVRYLVDDCGADPERIGILGLSMGAAVAAIVAGRLRERIGSCVLMNPVGRPVEDLSAFAMVKNVDVSSFPIEFNSFLFGRQFFEDLSSHTPLEEIKHAVCPVLIVSGTQDATINPVRSQEYFNVLVDSGRTAELYVIDGADHTFRAVRWERELINRVSHWFDSTLRNKV